ncbi:MAG: histidinol dehydrogenase [Thermoleophilia bacterium]
MSEYVKKTPPKAAADVAQVRDTVTRIIADVRARGLDAVREYSRRFDGWDPASFKVAPDEVERAKAAIAPDVLSSLDFAHAQIKAFAQRQRESMTEFEIETLPGVFLGQKQIPVASAGAYVPGGKYPMLMSAQMSILTAKVAGVERVVACAPPYEGKGMFPEMLWSMALAGADEIWCLGGVQALALMACGAEGYEPVDFISGPGNMYVAEAKRQLFGEVGIDLLAGPTEILVIADESADPRIVAADLLGQAEHGPTSPAILVSLSMEMAQAVLGEIERQLPELPTRVVAEQSWADCGEIVVVSGRDEAASVADDYAPEHLEVQTADPEWYLDHLRNYGTLCLGEEATITFSDKAIGTNHTLPTGRAARYTGGLWVGKFLKTVTYQRCTREGALAIAPHAGRLADAEHMLGHAKTAYLRIDKYAEGGGAV